MDKINQPKNINQSTQLKSLTNTPKKNICKRNKPRNETIKRKRYNITSIRTHRPN